MKNSFRSTKVFGFLIFMFLLIQTIIFYHTSVYLKEHSNHSVSLVHNQKECDHIPSDDESCSLLQEKQCDFRSDCFSIKGESCGSIIGDTTFIQCVNNYEAQITKKMVLTPRLPNWAYGHSDSNYICAYNEGVNDQVFRFSKIIPQGWTQVKCVKCVIHPDSVSSKKESGLSLVALVHKEYDSFANALRSWASSGLLEYADETILWINHKSPDQDPIEALAKEYGLTILSSEINLGIGPAVSNLILAAKNPLVIFLEKDWEVVENNNFIVNELEYAKRLVLSGVNGSRADAVKLRSRSNAGHPNIDPNLCIPPDFDMDELSEYAQYRWVEEINDYQWWLPHLFCNLNHFLDDTELLRRYPNRIWRCGSALCFDSAQCGWTNNPILFKKHWYLDTLYEISMREDNPTFEGGTYYAPEWVEPHWVIAETEGFFKHHEINEHM